MTSTDATVAQPEAPPKVTQTIYRHRATVRITHWGQRALRSHSADVGPQHPAGAAEPLLGAASRISRIRGSASIRIPAASAAHSRSPRPRNPRGIIISSSAWIFVVNLAAYLAYGFWSRHIQTDLTPTKAEWVISAKW